MLTSYVLQHRLLSQHTHNYQVGSLPTLPYRLCHSHVYHYFDPQLPAKEASRDRGAGVEAPRVRGAGDETSQV